MKLIASDNIEVMTCDMGHELEIVPMKGYERSRFAYEITHKRNGIPIENLETKGAFLGIIELGWCSTCKEYVTVLDDLCDNPEEWAKLPKWNGKKPQ